MDKVEEEKKAPDGAVVRKRKSEWEIRDLSVMDRGDGSNIGAGTYGIIFQATDNGVPVALKKIKMEREQEGFPVTAIREIKILKYLRTLNHENVVDLREIIVYDDEKDEDEEQNKEFSHGDVFMVFELVEFDLYGLLKSPSVQLSEEHVRSWTKQLLEGVKFLHENHILHRDIKSANILITKGNVLKIADWGLARFYQKSNHKMTFRVVTLWYRSPELLCGVRHYGPEVDIWSVGCIFGELKTRQPILAVKDSGARCSETQSESNQLDLLWHECGTPQGEVLKKYESYPLWETCKPTKPSNRKIRNKFDHDTKRWDTRSLLLLERFLDFDPEKRISAADALADDYFHHKPVKSAEELEVFETVECPRHMDAFKMQKEEFERAKKEKEKAAQDARDRAEAAKKAEANTRREAEKQKVKETNKYIIKRPKK